MTFQPHFPNGSEYLSPWVQAGIGFFVAAAVLIMAVSWAARRGIKLFSGGVSHAEFKQLVLEVQAIPVAVRAAESRMTRRLAQIEKEVAVEQIQQKNMERWQEAQDDRMAKIEDDVSDLERRVGGK